MDHSRAHTGFGRTRSTDVLAAGGFSYFLNVSLLTTVVLLKGSSVYAQCFQMVEMNGTFHIKSYLF